MEPQLNKLTSLLISQNVYKHKTSKAADPFKIRKTIPQQCSKEDSSRLNWAAGQKGFTWRTMSPNTTFKRR
jgi:hypothetical protein